MHSCYITETGKEMRWARQEDRQTNRDRERDRQKSLTREKWF